MWLLRVKWEIYCYKACNIVLKCVSLSRKSLHTFKITLIRCWLIIVSPNIWSKYFLILFAQTKIILFICWNNWIIKENKSFLLVEPCSRVSCCVEIQLKYFFRKYIFICAIYTLLLQLISAMLYDTCYVHGGSNSWEKPMPSGAKMEQCSVTLLPIGKPRAVDNIVSVFWGWHFNSSVCVCWAVIGNDATKLYTMEQYIKR